MPLGMREGEGGRYAGVPARRASAGRLLHRRGDAELDKGQQLLDGLDERGRTDAPPHLLADRVGLHYTQEEVGSPVG